jgi:polyhydroxyalkanoate synthase
MSTTTLSTPKARPLAGKSRKAGSAGRRATPRRAARAPRVRPSPAKAAPAAQAATPSLTGRAIQAGGALTELLVDAAENTLAINPLIGIRRRDVAGAAGALLKAVAVAPRRATRHYGRYLKELGKVVAGDSPLAAESKDRRFADAAWQGNAMYRRLMQAYLATQKELDEFIDESKLGPKDKGRAHFFASLLTDALAPSN